jgi:hypothetical protein
MIDYMAKIDAAHFLSFTVGADKTLPADYADHLPENKVPKGRSLTPVNDKGEAALGLVGDGVYLVRQLEGWLKKKGVPLLAQHRASKLIKAGDRIVGVEADHGGKTVRLRAKQGVVFATGGYAQNTESCATYQKFLYGACALPGSQGDFIRIGGEAGAKLGNLQSAWRAEVVLEEALQNRLMPQCAFFIPGDSMLLVNKYGRRVVDEKRNYNDRTKVHYTYDPVHEDYPNQLLFMVFDERTMDAFGGAYPIPAYGAPAPFVAKGDTLADLSAKLTERLAAFADKTGRVALAADFAEQLTATVERYNGYAKAGKDLEFSRGGQSYDRDWQAFFSKVREGSKYPANDMPNGTMYPFADKGPYYCVILGAGALDTNGGPEINHRAEVVDAAGKPIPGLYAAGNCVASPTREAYYGAGGTIGPAMTFGYIAALAATGKA